MPVLAYVSVIMSFNWLVLGCTHLWCLPLPVEIFVFSTVVQNGVQVMLMPELQRMFFEDFSVELVKESYAEGGWLIETNVRHSIGRIFP